MFAKQIKLLNNCDWEYLAYSDEVLISLINQLAEDVSNFDMLELYLNDNENGDICIVISIRNSGIQRMENSKAIYVHNVNYIDEQKELDMLKKEAYRIKKILKSKYPNIWVTSIFNWKYMR